MGWNSWHNRAKHVRTSYNTLVSLHNPRGRITLTIPSRSFSKYFADPSHNIAIATNPACCSLHNVDYRAGTIIFTNNGSMNLAVRSAHILAKQSWAADEISCDWSALSSKSYSHSWLLSSTSVSIRINTDAVRFLNSSFFLTWTGAALAKVCNPWSAALLNSAINVLVSMISV